MNSDSVKNLLPALASAIAAMPDPKKNAKNDHFKNRYADLGAVLECVFQPLADNGLVMTQTVHLTAEADVLCTRIWHVASGEWLESNMPLRPEKPTPQGVASAITYARRYAIKALFGMVDVDDDGNAASASKAVTQSAKSAEPVKRTRMELEACIAEAKTTAAMDVLRPHMNALSPMDKKMLSGAWHAKLKALAELEKDPDGPPREGSDGY